MGCVLQDFRARTINAAPLQAHLTQVNVAPVCMLIAEILRDVSQRVFWFRAASAIRDISVQQVQSAVVCSFWGELADG